MGGQLFIYQLPARYHCQSFNDVASHYIFVFPLHVETKTIKMVSVIAAHMRNRREYKTLTELFDKADVSGDGAVTMEEYMDVAKHFGIKLTEEELIGFVNIAKKGKVRISQFIFNLL